MTEPEDNSLGRLLKNNKFLTGFGDHPLGWMNTTVAYYPLFIYLFAKIHQSKEILEIGTDHGYSSYYLAAIAEENEGTYYGIDIEQAMLDRTGKMLDEADLPYKLILADTKKLEKIDFAERIDLAFLDGEHTTEAVEHEIELIYPLLPGNGWGYIFIHDIVDGGNANVWLKLQGDPRFEKLGMHPNYGMGILRKMEGLDYKNVADRFGIWGNKGAING